MLHDNGLGLPPATLGSALTIEAVTVPRWDPAIIIGSGVSDSPQLDILRYRAPAKFLAPDIVFSDPQPLLVRGGSFCLLAERQGVIPASTYLFGSYGWKELFGSIDRFEMMPDGDVLVAANCVAYNYYHWTFQCLAPILIAQFHDLGTGPAIVVAPLDAVQREALSLAGVDPARVIELPDSVAAVTERGIHSNLTSGEFAFVPHPAIAAVFESLGAVVPQSRFAGRKIFISRADTTSRKMVNEAALADALAGRGFDVVIAGRLTLSEQIGLFRDARLIVAQHGAALTNILFAKPGEEGPIIIELLQENYIHQAFLKISQVKRLRYHVVVNALLDGGRDGRHDSHWQADIPAVISLVDSL